MADGAASQCAEMMTTPILLFLRLPTASSYGSPEPGTGQFFTGCRPKGSGGLACFQWETVKSKVVMANGPKFVLECSRWKRVHWIPNSRS